MKINPRSLLAPTVAALVVGLAALVLASGGRSSAATSATTSAAVAVAGKSATLVISNFSYHPAVLTVKVGTTITVVNHDPVEHTATDPGGAFDTGTLNQGNSSHFTLYKPGTYDFTCSFHAFMHGVIKVVN